MGIHPRTDGGATLDATHLDLVRIYNLCISWLQAPPTDADPALTEWARVWQKDFGAAIGRPDAD